MSEWYETPYKGGPMVPVPGFPRVLHPPDAVKQPPRNGPDCEAYKRTAWRAGRWPGPASGFDRAYSNNFAHGKGPNVVDTGIAGIQRQQNMPDNGIVDKAFFNTLRSIRCPKGPHEGEMAMDANAANLIAQAWEMFGGEEPPSPPSSPSTTRSRALQAAINDLGYVESPRNSNQTKYGKWYGMDSQPWCAMAVTYWFEAIAGGSPSFTKGSTYAYCPYVVQDARNGRNGLQVVGSPVAGDLVLYDWSFDGTFDHIGIFEGWTEGSSSSFTALEGNTGPDDYSNGGMVMRCTRRVPDQGTVFVRVAE